jgi:hypothetical protein
MEQPILDLIVNRLERIEKQNDDQLELIRQHVEKDVDAWKTVETHATYFKIIGFGLTPMIAYIAAKLGLK